MQNKLTFQEFLASIDSEAQACGHKEVSYVHETGKECWRGYYDDGYSPEDAYREDCSNA